MPCNTLRRSQLITPFGVGSLFTTKKGISVICCGLDHWFTRECGQADDVDIEEFKLEEWRLEKELGVDHFRLPPDYRGCRRGINPPNSELTIPFLRFPRYHYCTVCGHLEELPLTRTGDVECAVCAKKGQKRYLVQVPFIAICDHGHIQDFPFREWVHKSADPSCKQPLRLKSSGGTSLSAQWVSCGCGVSRSLARITTATPDGEKSYLSNQLPEDGKYFCQGKRPWLHDTEGESCGRPLRGSMRNASNVYFPSIRSSIYLPIKSSFVSEELVSLLKSYEIKRQVDVLLLLNITLEEMADALKNAHSFKFLNYSLEQIGQGLQVAGYFRKEDTGEDADKRVKEEIEKNDEKAFRFDEYKILTKDLSSKNLKVELQELSRYESEAADFFDKILLVKKLRETRVFTGFSRVFSENDQTVYQKQKLLRKDHMDNNEKWLPAITVNGEGIFIVFNDEKIKEWESIEAVQQRVEALNKKYNNVAGIRRYKERNITPRFVLLHTFAHLLINRLTFECGYSSAALRERLYVSDPEDEFSMAGVLIYTAAGDSEGTMGGLVSLGLPGKLEDIMRRAIEEASWCSADPVCMEAGDAGGQGPDSCNLAACHSCGLLPETACEEFNRFLDRGLIVGSLLNKEIGYFSDWLEKAISFI